MKLAVLGAGVIGLTTGVILLEKYPKAKVCIYAHSTENLVSHVAGAQFYPIWLGDKVPKSFEPTLKKWLLYSRKRFEDLQGKTHGISKLTNFEFANSDQVPSYFYDVLPDLNISEQKNLPHAYSHILKFETIIINPLIYMNQLKSHFLKLGGKIQQKHFKTQHQVLNLPETTIFNCMGVGAGLFEDSFLKPVKGVILMLKPIKNLDFVVSYDEYIVAPRQGHTYLGASYNPNNHDSSITQTEKDFLFDSIKQTLESPGHDFSLPRGTFKKQNVVGAMAGFRPVRDIGPRVETQLLGGKKIIHNYGHGGNGVILSWGSAKQATELLAS